MRTTLTLEDELVKSLKEEASRSGRSFKETVNICLRAGLNTVKDADKAEKFQVRARSLNARPGIEFDDAAEKIDILDIVRSCVAEQEVLDSLDES